MMRSDRDPPKAEFRTVSDPGDCMDALGEFACTVAAVLIVIAAVCYGLLMANWF